MEIRVRRLIEIYCDDYYEVDEINDEIIQRCIEDDYTLFKESDPQWESFNDISGEVYDEDDNLLKTYGN
jgi:hypothetical protein